MCTKSCGYDRLLKLRKYLFRYLRAALSCISTGKLDKIQSKIRVSLIQCSQLEVRDCPGQMFPTFFWVAIPLRRVETKLGPCSAIRTAPLGFTAAVIEQMKERKGFFVFFWFYLHCCSKTQKCHSNSTIDLQLGCYSCRI